MLRSRWFWLLWAGFLLISVIFWKQFREKTIIASDTGGYYFYLPATFIYGFREPAPKANTELSIHEKYGVVYTRFSYGVALFEAPFFLLAHGFSLAAGYPADGYTDIYEFSIYVAMAFWLALGCCLLYAVLRRFAAPWTSRIIILVFLFGTDLFYFSFWGGTGHSHTIQFLLMAALLYVAPDVWTNKKARWAWFLIASLMTLVRIPHLGWALLPFFYGLKSWEELKQRIYLAFKGYYWLGFLAVLLLVMFPQLCYYKLSHGRWFINAYAPDGHIETFPYLWSPRLLRILFDVRNGLFVYAPVLFFCIPGFWLLWKKGYKGFVLGSLLLLGMLWYTFGAWHMYWLGGLGHRGFIDAFPLLAIFMAVFVESWKQFRIPAIRWILQTLIFFFVFLGFGFNIKYEFPWQPPYFVWEDYRIVVSEIYSLDWSRYRPYSKPPKALPAEIPND